MTNTELLAKIKAEIERRIKIPREDEVVRQNCTSDFLEGKIYGYEEILSFLSTLEESEKPMNPDELDEEINRLWESFADEMEGPHNLFDIYARLARHFAQWGAEHLKK